MNLLDANRFTSWCWYKTAAGDGTLFHRVGPWFGSRKALKKDDLAQYQENRDYFYSEENYLNFVHNQLRSHGLNVGHLIINARRYNKSKGTAEDQYEIPTLNKDESPAKSEDGLNVGYVPMNVGEIKEVGHHALLDNTQDMNAESPASDDSQGSFFENLGKVASSLGWS